jgi:ribosomal protein L16 Arg81 hydroxylase
VTGTAAFAGRGLAWLLHPVEPAEFLASAWERQPLEISRGDPDRYGALPGLEDVDALALFPGDNRLVRTGPDGKLSERPWRPDVHHVYRAYDDGYTVVLSGIHARSPAVGALCRELEADLEHPAGANLYLTPRDAQGFRPHVDAHDVVIAQLHGEKVWRVGGVPSRSFPTAAVPGAPVAEVPEPRSYRLAPGDALYIPRGWAHEAVTQASSSLHLTIGLHALTRGDLLAEALRLAVAAEPGLRRALPTGHLATALSASDVAALAGDLAAAVSPAMLDAARLSLGSRLLARQAATAGHFRSLDRAADLTAGSVVTRGFQGPCRVRAAGERIVADYPGNYLSVPPFLAPALEHAVHERTFTVGSLPGELSDAERIEFAARLVGEGFLTVVSTGEDPST